MTKSSRTLKSSKDVAHRQKFLIKRLKRTSIKMRRYNFLKECGPDHCVGDPCTEVCRFARERYKGTATNAVLTLLKNIKGPLYEARVSRGIWARPFGELHKVSIATAEKLSQRAFDSLNDPGIVAVGSVKVAPTYEEPKGWICEIHQVVGGVDRSDIDNYDKRQYISSQIEVPHQNVLWAKRIKNLARALSDVFDYRFATWQYPCDAVSVPKANKEQRTEYYDWALNLRMGERVIRYGCDRYFNRLEKEHRLVRIKSRKRHPNPTWLAPFQYGNHHSDCECGVCQGEKH